MSLVINNNLMAVNVTRNLNSSYGKLATSTRRLSSGLRVGTAADDAAGLAMRELMRADIKTLAQGLRNANDGISMIQTADGALGVIDAKLIRMKELAEQAATGTYTDAQRLMINQEYQLMAKEITRMAMDTDFNSRKLLAGTGQEIHVEKSVAQNDATRSAEATMVDEDGNTESWSSNGPNAQGLATSDAVNTPLGEIDANGVRTVTKAQAADTLTYTSRSGIAAVTNSVDTDADGGTLDLKTGELAGIALDGTGSTLTGTYLGTKLVIETRTPTGDWTDITSTVGTTAVATGTNGAEMRVTLHKSDGSIVRDTFSNHSGQFNIVKNAAPPAPDTLSYTVTNGAAASTKALQVKSEFAASKTFEQITKTGVKVVNDAVSFLEDNSKTYLPAKAGFTHDSKTGELKKVQSVESSASSSYGSLKTPVQDYTIEAYNETTNTWDKLSLGSTPPATLDIPDTVKKFRITAEYSDYNKVRDTFSNNTGGKFTLTKTQYGMDLGMTTTNPSNSSTQLNVKSEDLVVVNVHFGSGSQKVDSYDTYINMASAKSLGVGEEAGDHIKTQKMAKKALDNLNIAITRKDEIRAEIGSTQNRLAATVENVSIQKENLQASESRISDVDVASEMTQFNKVQIMTNAAVSMLAQANSLPKAAQKLIDGR